MSQSSKYSAYFDQSLVRNLRFRTRFSSKFKELALSITKSYREFELNDISLLLAGAGY